MSLRLHSMLENLMDFSWSSDLNVAVFFFIAMCRPLIYTQPKGKKEKREREGEVKEKEICRIM
jgi:hypothetical protein